MVGKQGSEADTETEDKESKDSAPMPFVKIEVLFCGSDLAGCSGCDRISVVIAVINHSHDTRIGPLDS
jgi:hypothetical protein